MMDLNDITDLNDRLSFRSSLNTDKLCPALLLAGTQIMISLLGAVLLTDGGLA